jgi:hypothetical protein
LASRGAHNSPAPEADEFPKRLGPFLWSHHHPAPAVHAVERPGVPGMSASLRLPIGTLRRTITQLPQGEGWEIADEFSSHKGVPRPFSVHWQFAPGSFVKMLDNRRLSVNRAGVSLVLQASPEWAHVDLVEQKSPDVSSARATQGLESEFAGCVSPAFRHVEWAPFVKLLARPRSDQPCVFRTTFLALPSS